VVHHRDPRDPDALRGAHKFRELRRELGGATAPSEVRDVISKVQRYGPPLDWGWPGHSGDFTRDARSGEVKPYCIRARTFNFQLSHS
jgi:hypothetical protein